MKSLRTFNAHYYLNYTAIMLKDLSISVLKVGRLRAGHLACAAFFIFMTSCIKDELPIPPHDAGDLKTQTISLTQDYHNQIFYSLSNNSVISTNSKFDWDIAFDACENGSNIYLNQARFMFVQKTNEKNISELNDTINFFRNRAWDASNNPDSLALGSVLNMENCFWIDRGYDINGDQIPLMRAKFEILDKQTYKVTYAEQNQMNPTVAFIKKDSTYNRVYFSFTANKTVRVEPPKNTWDIQFTQYVHTFKDPYIPYLVTGAILNSFQTLAAVDSTLDFNKIDVKVAQGFQLSSRADVIGYNWKVFANNVYTINLQYNYVINDQNNFYYKMRFTGFYNDKGSKGYPKFEFQRL